MVDYDVITGDSTQELVRGVKEMIDKGYGPIGGVAVLRRTWTNERKGYEESETWYYQAVIKNDG